MLDAAAAWPYLQLINATAEATGLPDASMDRIVILSVFDVTEQEQVLLEANRLLSHGGLMLVTGKHDTYHEDDHQAFIAERNAWLKEFPNHFTDLSVLFDASNPFGLVIEHGLAFNRRGDMGENNAVPLSRFAPERFYEYLLILRKAADASVEYAPEIACRISKTAYNLAARHGFADDVPGFFRWHKETYGEQVMPCES